MKDIKHLCFLIKFIVKHCMRPEINPKFLLKLGPNPARTRIEKPSPIYNSAACKSEGYSCVLKLLPVVIFIAFFTNIR